MLSLRVREPAEKVALKIGNILTTTLRAVRPGEMVRINLTPEQMAKLSEAETEIEVSCTERS